MQILKRHLKRILYLTLQCRFKQFTTINEQFHYNQWAKAFYSVTDKLWDISLQVMGFFSLRASAGKQRTSTTRVIGYIRCNIKQLITLGSKQQTKKYKYINIVCSLPYCLYFTLANMLATLIGILTYWYSGQALCKYKQTPTHNESEFTHEKEGNERTQILPWKAEQERIVLFGA